jgi:hypothetical protein
MMAMSRPRTTYALRPRTRTAAELDALAAVYRFILDCHEKKKAARPGDPADMKVVYKERSSK